MQKYIHACTYVYVYLCMYTYIGLCSNNLVTTKTRKHRDLRKDILQQPWYTTLGHGTSALPLEGWIATLHLLDEGLAPQTRTK